MSAAAPLTGPLLQSVSRSFYLTIRILPEKLRGPIGLAYLLARASDTIADSDCASVPVRLAHLASFGEMIAGRNRKELAALQRDIQPPKPGEAELIGRLGECFSALDRLDQRDWEVTIRALDRIISGQKLDLERFGNGPAALPEAAALEEYCYLVAGCVGSFWTWICFHHLPDYSEMAEKELATLGVSYGRGLQLVNILRDLPSDLRDGRCYLPADELREVGADPLKPDAAQWRPIIDRWIEKAAAHLADGQLYLRAIRPARIRAGVYIPLDLGLKTLALLRARNPLESPERLKVPRSDVRKAMLKAVWVALT